MILIIFHNEIPQDVHVLDILVPIKVSSLVYNLLDFLLVLVDNDSLRGQLI